MKRPESKDHIDERATGPKVKVVSSERLTVSMEVTCLASGILSEE